MNPFSMSNRVYDVVKRLVQVILPAAGALYFGLAGYWDLPNSEAVVGTIALIATFLGVSLGISSAQYTADDRGTDGKMVVAPGPEGGTVFSLELDGDPAALGSQKHVVFKVVTEVDDI